MDSDDPDLEAFKSNLCLMILRERESGKAAALVSNLCLSVLHCALQGCSATSQQDLVTLKLSKILNPKP